jgi:acetyl esterase/lipase
MDILCAQSIGKKSTGYGSTLTMFYILAHTYKPDFKALWIIPHADQPPDMIVLYCHGGGFAMGSGYFYLEFLFAWVSLLQQSGYRNPAILSLEYTLVPDAVYPTQVKQALAAYRYAYSVMNDNGTRICVSGDSAGGSLVLSLLLHLRNVSQFRQPGLAVLISPWVTTLSQDHVNTASDYLDMNTLHQYGAQYMANVDVSARDVFASPGNRTEMKTWIEASPISGWIVAWGIEELLHSDINTFVSRLKKAGLEVSSILAPEGIHAWPVAALYLGDSREQRLLGLKTIVERMRQKMDFRKQ